MPKRINPSKLQLRIKSITNNQRELMNKIKDVSDQTQERMLEEKEADLIHLPQKALKVDLGLIQVKKEANQEAAQAQVLLAPALGQAGREVVQNNLKIEDPI